MTNGSVPATPSALDGIRVIEVGVFIAAPFATLQLADLGADVIKVESLDGEPVRASGPFVSGRELTVPAPESLEAFGRTEFESRRKESARSCGSQSPRTSSSRTSVPERCVRSACRLTTCGR